MPAPTGCFVDRSLGPPSVTRTHDVGRKSERLSYREQVDGRDGRPVTLPVRVMIIKGTIAEVMESWPLQLTVESEGAVYHVSLGLETVVTRGPATLEPGALLPGQRVVITGQSGVAPMTMNRADTVKILG